MTTSGHCGYSTPVVTVGVRNLKDSLSRYLKMVKGGERIVVTEHSRIIAEIVPASAMGRKTKLLDELKAEFEDRPLLAPKRKA